MHLNGVQKLRHQNHSLPATGIHSMLYEVSDDQVRKRAKPEQIKVLIDSVLLAIKMNSSLYSVQDINEHM